jgi:hypothetical protein
MGRHHARNNESAGNVKSSRTRPGNPCLQGALGAAAMACAQNPRTYLGARYRRIATRRGPQKANVAVQHAMLTAIWHMGTTGTFYDDPGADYFTRLNPDRARNRAIRQLQAMGYHVTLERPPDTNPRRRQTSTGESSRQMPDRQGWRSGLDLCGSRLWPRRAARSCAYQQEAISLADLVPAVAQSTRNAFERVRLLHAYGVLSYELFTAAEDLAP